MKDYKHLYPDFEQLGMEENDNGETVIVAESLLDKDAALSQMELQNEDNLRIIDGEGRVISDALMMCEQMGSVDRQFADTYREYLPADLPLETFSQHPTRTNLTQVQESLGTGIKIAMMVGAALVLGTLAIVVMRALGRKTVKRPELERIKAASKIQVSIKAGSGPSIIQHRLDAIARDIDKYKKGVKEFNEKFNLSQGFATRAEEANANMLLAGILDDSYNFLAGTFSMFIDRQMDHMCRFVTQSYCLSIAWVAKKHSDGEEVTAETFYGHLKDYSQGKARYTLADDIRRWAEKVGLGGETADDIWSAFSKKFLQKADRRILMDKSFSGHGKSKFNQIGLDARTDYLVDAKRDLEDVAKTVTDIVDKAKKGAYDELPKDVVAAIRQVGDELAAQFRAIDVGFRVVAEEYAALLSYHELTGAALSDNFKAQMELFIAMAEKGVFSKDALKDVQAAFKETLEAVKSGNEHDVDAGVRKIEQAKKQLETIADVDKYMSGD